MLPQDQEPTYIIEAKKRCVELGMKQNEPSAPKNIMSELKLAEKKETYKEILEVVKSFSEKILKSLEGTPILIVISDENGYLLETVGDETIKSTIAQLGIKSGIQFSEDMGTNVISLSLKQDHPVQLIGTNHFHTVLHNSACYGVPYHDKNENIILGSISIMTAIILHNPLFLMTLTTLVDAIERELLLRKQNDKLNKLNQTLLNKNRKIEEQKKELEAIIESISDGISIIGDKGEFKLFNENARETFFPPQDYLGDVHEWYKHSEFFYFEGNKIPPENNPVTRVFRGERFSNLKVTARFPNKLVHLDVSGTPIYDAEGKFALGVICSRDMTNYYKREEIIKSRNEFLDRLIDNLELPVIRLSCPDLKVSEINQKAVDVVNLFKPDIISAVQIKGNKISDIVTNIVYDEYSNKIYEVIKEKKTKYINKKNHTINGDKIYWNVIFEPVFGLNGKIQEILVLIIDITTEIKSNNTMESALKSQEEFLANISHELKTPLNVIYSTIQLFNVYCKSGSLDQNKDSVFRYINSMMQNCYRLSKLINNIVDLSKIEAGFFELILSNNNIVEVVEEIVMSVTPYTDIKGLNIIFDTDIEEKIIACDPEKIERILLNLISNAIKFSDVGNEIFVNIKEKNQFIEISIKDNGIGIEHNQLDMIFNRFKQVDKSLSRNAEGTGIGLSLVKAIVEMHQGRIYVESEFGKGSTFTVELPTRKVIQENIVISGKIRNKTEDLQVELSDLCI
jgi:signal transduction histidine kinase/PAS domain-containing protein